MGYQYPPRSVPLRSGKDRRSSPLRTGLDDPEERAEARGRQNKGRKDTRERGYAPSSQNAFSLYDRPL